MAKIESHVHHGFVAVAPVIAIVIAFFGTLHLWAIGSDSRVAKAWLALGF